MADPTPVAAPTGDLDDQPVLTTEDAVREVGATGLKQSSGIIIEEFDRNLQGAKANKVYTEMGDNSSVIGGVLLLMTQWMRSAEWSVVPFEPDVDQYVADAEFVEQCMDDMSTPWTTVIDDASSLVQFGWSWLEVVYKPRRGPQLRAGDSSKYNDGKWGWRKMAYRSQDSLQRWSFDEDGGIAGWYQQTMQKGNVFLSIAKGLLFRSTTRKNNPQGRSMLRNAYEPWWKKKKIEEVEGIGIERNLAGMPVVYVDPLVFTDPDKADVLASYEQMAKDVKVDEQLGAVLPSVFDDNGNRLYQLELLASPGAAPIDTERVIGRYAREMAMSVLADVILMGHEQAGRMGSSQALAVTKDEMLRRSLMGFLNDMAEVFNRHEIPRLFRLNGVTTGELPRLAVAPPESTTAQQIIDELKALAETGAVLWPSAELSSYVQEKTGIPMSDVLEEQQELAELSPAPPPITRPPTPTVDPLLDPPTPGQPDPPPFDPQTGE